MRFSGSLFFALLASVFLFLPAFCSGAESRHDLTDWEIQSSAVVTESGATLSKPGVVTTKWLHVKGPATVVAAQVENKVYPDPYFGMNLRQLPGMSYEISKIFSRFPMADDSPYKRSWWYRTEFTVP